MAVKKTELIQEEEEVTILPEEPTNANHYQGFRYTES